MKKRNFIWIIILAVGVIAALSVALQPKVLPVESARVTRGPLEQAIEAEGKTRVLDRFIIAAPVTGRMARIKLKRGDRVERQRLITTIDPLPLSPLDPRQYAEANARVSAALSVEREAQALVERTRVECEQARRERQRLEKLIETGDASRQEFERARDTESACLRQLEATRFKAAAASWEVEAARAALIPYESRRATGSSAPVIVRSPVSGRVLSLIEENERVITAGSPLIELSNPDNLEIVIDVLSTDAVRIRPGTAVRIRNWGGDDVLRAQVRLIEPMAFTKVSALGIEEQRVNVIADFIDPAGPLGDGYRVEAEIVIWRSDNTLQAPASALFRRGDQWSAFTIEDGVARQVDVEIGHRTPLAVEVLKGLREGAEVIVHPTNDLSPGIRVKTSIKKQAGE
ncbi:MAG: efflux RND transporter periplasmic adaptor subunit [Acidobacteriota bacterium]|nr:MAG: efflux RND transporter periplasmic adaptor subunit [Acidobacteriota bacterium]